MITIKIYIYDPKPKSIIQNLIDENDRLGFEKNKIDKTEEDRPKHQLVDFNFDERRVLGFWCDPDMDEDTGTFDLIFYIDGTAFRTPCNNEKIKIFTEILNK